METLSKPNDQTSNYAGFWLRFAAHIIDWAMLCVFYLITFIPSILLIISFASRIEKSQSFHGFIVQGNFYHLGMILGIVLLLIILNFLAGWLYYALMEASRHQGTVGKIAVGIIVTNIQGDKVSFTQATGRYFAKIISNFTFYVGYIVAGFTDKKQALHDIIANCLVLKRY